jgi:putative DNA methylase
MLSKPPLPLTKKRSRVIESEDFPFETISELAEIESWRKEIYRPVYHVHKWWACRLGTVFRAIILGCALPEGESVVDAFYKSTNLKGLVVFDPFMGSGTTVGEAHKLGCYAVGKDINPVAYESVRVALGPIDRNAVLSCFDQLSQSVGKEILKLYKCTDDKGHQCDVLYYFWVKTIPCPQCTEEVKLFSTYLFAQHAYVKREPRVQVFCPDCGEIFAALHHDVEVTCTSCRKHFDPHAGPVKGASATCTCCAHKFPVGKTCLASGTPPNHKLYAKLVLTPAGDKRYLRADSADASAYQYAEVRLEEEDLPLPNLRIEHGYNTQQVIKYGYTNWRQFFNSRQLLALGLLAKAIAKIPDDEVRGAMALLLSSTLEFNNMFASYKGEGTGAVRHMFAHHILKPERTPIEANVWGTPRSSGAFSTLFKSRLLRALDYRDRPFEVGISDGKSLKVFGSSPAFSGNIHPTWDERLRKQRAIVLSCGSSSHTDLPKGSVDFVVTDPPFFDNVHYSELADFFYAWQTKVNPQSVHRLRATTRDTEEVQDIDAASFAEKLEAVWRECHRVLKDSGLLVFSYHHSRKEGWSSVAQAITRAGFAVVNAHPLKSEMSVATPKTQTKEPIDIDILLVCCKRSRDLRCAAPEEKCLVSATDVSLRRLKRFSVTNRKLSRSDIFIMLKSQFLVELFAGRSPDDILSLLDHCDDSIGPIVERLYDTFQGWKSEGPQSESLQSDLFSATL